VNHIQKLILETAEQASRIKATLEEVQEIRSHLLNPKFQGVDTDGDRKDWISTADVLRRLETLSALLNGTN
jgi:hypothetical protein